MKNTPWARVDRRNPCPICGKPDWCLSSQDGKAVICARIESDRPAGHKGAGWIHVLDSRIPPRLNKIRIDAKQHPKAPRSVLDMAYRALLSELTLSEPHHQSLRQRGLTDTEISTLQYRTLPLDGRRDVTARIQAANVRLAGVPGFYLRAGRWQLAGPVGIAIPVRDTQRRIVGLQVRCDSAEGGRYKWLSSRGFNGGSSPGAPAHVSGAVSNGGEVWITEGPLKADISALKLKRLVLAVPGVASWSSVVPIVQELEPKRAVVSFDMDKASKPTVEGYTEALVAWLMKYGIRTFEADWDSRFKGLDDLLVGDELCQR